MTRTWSRWSKSIFAIRSLQLTFKKISDSFSFNKRILHLQLKLCSFEKHASWRSWCRYDNDNGLRKKFVKANVVIFESSLKCTGKWSCDWNIKYFQMNPAPAVCSWLLTFLINDDFWSVQMTLISWSAKHLKWYLKLKIIQCNKINTNLQTAKLSITQKNKNASKHVVYWFVIG